MVSLGWMAIGAALALWWVVSHRDTTPTPVPPAASWRSMPSGAKLPDKCTTGDEFLDTNERRFYQCEAPNTWIKRVPPHEAEVMVGAAKQISPNETVRLLTMPSQVDVFGTRCVLYTNRETGHAALSCGREEALPDDSGSR